MDLLDANHLRFNPLLAKLLGRGCFRMNVLLIGANSQIGRLITNKMQNDEAFNLLAAYRKDDQINDAQARGLDTAKIDLEEDIAHLEKAMDGIDTVIFAAGSGGSTGADKTMMIDLDGAVKVIEAAKRTNVKRFVMISAINANRREVWSYASYGSSTPSYYHAAKYYADVWLLESGLDYTIIRPSGLTNDEGTGKIEVAEELDTEKVSLEIPQEDVANVVIESLKNDTTINKDFDVTSGLDSISEALSTL